MARKKSVALTTIQRRGLDKFLPPEEAGAVYGTVNHTSWQRVRAYQLPDHADPVFRRPRQKVYRQKTEPRERRTRTDTENAVRRMTRCRDYLYIHRPHGESIAVFEVAVGKGSGRSLRKED